MYTSTPKQTISQSQQPDRDLVHVCKDTAQIRSPFHDLDRDLTRDTGLQGSLHDDLYHVWTPRVQIPIS